MQIILALIIITANKLQYMFAMNKFYACKFDFYEDLFYKYWEL